MPRRHSRDLEPIRAELFGVERLEQHATTLAAAQTADLRPRPGYRLLAALEENARILQSAYTALTDAVQRDETISPAAEWLIDNFHIVDEQLREIREDLPPKFYRQLPKLTSGPLVDHPRVYGLAWAFVAHTDSRYDPDLLERFVRSYQRIVPLTMGELWALPITLRILLVENLRRIAERIVTSRDERVEANQLADLLLAASGRSSADLLASLRPYEVQPLARAFAVELVQRLRESDPDTMPVVGWLERRLAERHTTPEELVRAEHASQLSAHATVANIITSMRQISAFDWATFFESVSLVEAVLRRDPAGIYPQMDFATRDTYRHAVELLARGSALTEQD
ncbi:MAG: glycosyl transferase, partial [Gemmatimonadota bacterium]